MKKALLLISLLFMIGVVVIKKENMTYRQSFLKAFYPAVMSISKVFSAKSKVLGNDKNVAPTQSFYNLSFKNIAGEKINMDRFRGKKVLLVNTASDCGFTAQLTELQQLQNEHPGNLVIIGFPSNDFQDQEKGSNETIAAFCKKNYDVSFLLAQKSVVVSNKSQSPIFQWLSARQQNGWCSQTPEWNFSKYLVNGQGMLVGYFGPAISPLSSQLTKKL